MFSGKYTEPSALSVRGGSGQQHHVFPAPLYHGPWDRYRENVLAHSTVSRCHFSNRLHKTRSEIIEGRRRAYPLLSR